MRRGLPWLSAAFVLVSAVVSVRAAYDDSSTTFVIKKPSTSQDRVVLALDNAPERVVLTLLTVQKRPEAPVTLPAADEQALFGIEAPPPAAKPETVDVALVTPELPVVEETPRKRIQTATKPREERCGRLCRSKRYAVQTRDRVEPRKRTVKRYVPAKPVPVVEPDVVATAATTSKDVDLELPPQASDSAPAIISAEPTSSGTSGGIRLNGRTSLTVRHLSTVVPRAPDSSDGRAFNDDREDPSRNGAAVGVTFKLN